MTELFLNLVNMSISAGWLVLAVLALRFILKKAPKWVNVLLWGIVAVRLACPFSIESALSLIPSAQTIPVNIGMDLNPAIDSGISAINHAVNPLIGQSNMPMAGASVNPLQITIAIYANIWVLGMLAMAIYTAVSYLALRRKLRTAVILRGNIFQCETVSSPFVLGILRPKIYLPYTIDGQNLGHVVAHEQAHIRRKDHWWKPLGFLLLTVYWFNPLMWVAYILLCRDIELACDEKVIGSLDHDQRADYTQALVACSVDRRRIAACPLAFGEVGVKDRVKSVMNYRKPTFWIILTAAVACVVVAVCFLTNPLDSVDYLKFTGWDSDDPVVPDRMCYEINLGNRVMQGEIFVEEWSYGTCVRSAPVVMTQFVDSIHIIMRERRNGDMPVGMDIQIETNQYGGSLMTYFPYPENHTVSSYYFARNELNKKIRLSPGKEVILEARSLDLAEDGIRLFTSETLIQNPEVLQTEEYMILIRAVFSDDPLGAAEESPSSTPHSLLRAEILEIHDGYCLVAPVEGSWELSSADKIEVPLQNMTFPTELKVGQILEIEYDGQLQETYPARIHRVYSIQLITGKEIASGMESTYEIYNVAPLEDLPENYSLEEATIDKCVIMVDGDVRDNTDVWAEFVTRAYSGTQASVRLVRYYHGSETEPSSMYVYEITYDGSVYQIRWFEDGREYVQEYRYLRYFEGVSDTENAKHDAYISYILTDNTWATRQELFLSYASSAQNAAIPHFEVYTDLIYYPDHPEIPEILTRAELMVREESGEDGAILAYAYQEENMLDRLQAFLASAEALGYVPKTYGIRCDLILTGADGSIVELGMDAESDYFVLNGIFYDYGPGYDAEGCLNATKDLLTLLGLQEWP